MFRRRSKDEQSAPSATATAEPDGRRGPQAPKGRPTPKRSDAEALRRRRPGVPTAPADRKTSSRQTRETRRAQLTRQREALAGGDERYLPLRDKGPVRKLCRNYVDTRLHVAELFLPLAVAILVLSMVPNLQIKDIALLLWMLLIILIVVQSVVTGFRLRKVLRQRFPDEPKPFNAVAYAIMRTLQMRRMRLPKPQVKRGEHV